MNNILHDSNLKITNLVESFLKSILKNENNDYALSNFTDELQDKLMELSSKCIDLCMGQYGFNSLNLLGYIIRLRNKNGKCVMESKKRISENSWEEASIPVETMKYGYEFLTNIGLKPYLYINRIREVRSIKETKIFIDKIELLGTFVEFELKEGFSFEDIKYYLEENGIKSEPEKLYGDIFKDKMNDNGFRNNFNKALNDSLNNN